MSKETVSLELLTIKAKRALGARIEALVAEWVARKEFTYFYSTEQLAQLSTITAEETGMNVSFRMVDRMILNAHASIVRLPGHGGNTYINKFSKPLTMAGSSVPDKLKTISIDLDKGKISGQIFSDFKNEIVIYTGLVNHSIALTTEEITALILHELGHCWNQYMALADYVWLNYYLQDGVDVILGKKPNVYKLEVLSEKGLEKYCDDKELLAEIQKAPTVANLRRALLVASVKAPRHHLTSKTNDTSKLREEQLADLYASRMGYSRASITLHAKITKVYGSRQLTSNAVWTLAETTKLLLGIGSALSVAAIYIYPPALLAAIAFNMARSGLSVADEPEIYDNDLERMLKMRRDLIAQLKVLGSDPTTEEKMLEDVKTIDDLIAMYRNHDTLWEVVKHTLTPSYRRQRHQRAREEKLEQLLNNDVAIVAAKFNSLSRKLS